MLVAVWAGGAVWSPRGTAYCEAREDDSPAPLVSDTDCEEGEGEGRTL